ncbi:MAG: hypothetical protein IJI44_07780 [Erysipelotrichaceae bacterium]|nr:hypothetical protein [Erysipelotrichaceae bacterium]
MSDRNENADHCAHPSALCLADIGQTEKFLCSPIERVIKQDGPFFIRHDFPEGMIQYSTLPFYDSSW